MYSCADLKNRITSYNVCYTKLLRSILSAEKPAIQKRGGEAAQQLGRQEGCEQGKEGAPDQGAGEMAADDDHQQGVLDEAVADRITSYNVCYTKLLRRRRR